MELVDVRSESTKLGPLTRYNGTPFYSHVARWDLTGGSHADPEVHARPGNMDDMLRALNEGWVDARIDPKAEGVMIDIEMGGNTRFTFPGAEWEDPVTPIAAKQTIIKGDGSSRFSELLTKGDLIWRDYAREKLWYLYLYRAYAERWGGEDFAAQIGAAAPLRVGSWNMWTTPNMEHYQPSEAKHQFVWDLMELQTRLFTGGGEILDEIGVSPRFFAAYVNTTDVRIDFFEKWKAKFDLKMRIARATSHDAIPVVWPYMAAKGHNDPINPKKQISWQTVRDEERAKAIKAGISEELLPDPGSVHIPLPEDWMRKVLSHLRDLGFARCAFWSAAKDPWTRDLPAIAVLEDFIAKGRVTRPHDTLKPVAAWSMVWCGARSVGSFTFEYRDGGSGVTPEVVAKDFELIRSILDSGKEVLADHTTATVRSAKN